MGFLETYVDKMPNSEGQIRYFYVNFQKLTEEEVLTKLVREKSTLLEAMRAYMEYHADEEFKALCPSAVKEKPKKNQEEKRIEEIRVMLEETLNERREMYNNGKLDIKPTRKLHPTTVVLTNQQKRGFLDLETRYGIESIHQAFIAYCDEVLEKVCKPKNLFNYFLTRDRFHHDYSIFINSLNSYMIKYSYQPNKRGIYDKSIVKRNFKTVIFSACAVYDVCDLLFFCAARNSLWKPEL